MKDKVARKTIEVIKDDMEKRLQKLEAQPLIIVFDCPKCKHKTLAKKVQHRDNSTPTSWHYISLFYAPNDIYCYTCGKTFRPTETKTTYEEVKE